MPLSITAIPIPVPSNPELQTLGAFTGSTSYHAVLDPTARSTLTYFTSGSSANDEIAPARTFVYYEDVESLMEKNLIKGGSLENAVVVRGDAVLSKEPLRFPDEFVRHKMKDQDRIEEE